LSDDDFEAEAREDAVAYAQAQEVEAQRESIREANKIRRKEGLPRVPLPRRPKAARKAVKRDPDISATDEDAELTSDEEHHLIKSGNLKEKFTYEGRESSDDVDRNRELTTYQRSY